MAFSEEPGEGKGGNFKGLLALLAAEHQRVCRRYSDLAVECSRLRARLEFNEGKDDSYTTSDTINLREAACECGFAPLVAPKRWDCVEYDCYLPLDAYPAGQLPDEPYQDSLSRMVRPEPVRPKQEPLKRSVFPEPVSQRENSTKPPYRQSSVFEPEKVCCSPSDDSSRKEQVQVVKKGRKGKRQFDRKSSDSRTSRITRRKTKALSLHDALRGTNIRIASAGRFVINPERNNYIKYWEQVTIAALGFVAIVTPMQVAMMDTKLDALFIISSIIDLVFLFDMFLQFFLMYPVKTNYGVTLENRHSKIVMNYMKSWFILDVVSILPFDLISVLGDASQVETVKAVKVIRLLRLLKLARMRKVTRLFRRLEMAMAFAYQRLALVKFLTMLFLVTHWMANLWALTLVLVDEDVPRWVDAFESIEASVDVKTKDSIWKLYLTCLYFTSYTITSVGYGDIGPQNIIERMVCTLMIFVSGITWALLIAQVCSIVSSMDAEEQNFRKSMDELNYMMDSTELPIGMRRRLRSFFLSNKASARHARYLKIVESMSPALRGEVCLEMNRMWIQKVSFLKAFAEEGDCEIAQPIQTFMVDVSRSLQAQVYAQGEAFGEPQVLYILNRGLASHKGRVRRIGAVWGTDFVLSNTTLLDPSACFALTYVEVTCLERGTFLDLVDKHKSDCPHISKVVRRYLGWLAFQRWILLESSKKIQQSRADRNLKGGTRVH